MRKRTPCCLDPQRACGTRWDALASWVARVTGKGFRLVELSGDEQGRSPFFAQPVGYDGRTFFIANDGLCDTEKLLHEACHFLMSPRERRNLVNYGLGPGPFRPVDDFVSDNEELAASLLQRKIAPFFQLAEHKMSPPDYNIARRRHLDWDDAEARAQEVFARVESSLPATADEPRAKDVGAAERSAGGRGGAPTSRRGLAGIVLAASALTLSTRNAHAQSASPEAQAHFDRGRQWFAAHNCDEALREFSAAQAIQPSPNALLYSGLCHQRAGRFVDAYRELSRAADLAEARAPQDSRYARTAESARRAAGDVSQHIARLFVRVTDAPNGLVVRVNGRALDAAEWNGEVPTEPGEVRVDGDAPGRASFHRSASLTAGSQADVNVRLGPEGEVLRPDLSAVSASSAASANASSGANEGFSNVRTGGSNAGARTNEPSRPTSPMVVTGGVFLGVSGALFVMGAITGGLALSSHAALTMDCPQPTAPTCMNLEARVNGGRTLVATTNVGLIGGGAVAVVGVALIVGGVLTSAPPASATSDLPTFARVRPFFDPASGRIGVWGTF